MVFEFKSASGCLSLPCVLGICASGFGSLHVVNSLQKSESILRNLK